ncbi:MAG: SUMF1/EgtB/PvdO family nonheme iron enzyme [Bryobacteraceae bacterium]
MVRGGSWNNNPRNLRVSNRNRNEPDNRNDNLGFRCVRDVKRSRLTASQPEARRSWPAGARDLHFRAALPASVSGAEY